MDVTLLASSLALSSYLPKCLLLNSSSSSEDYAAMTTVNKSSSSAAASSSFSWVLTTASSLSFLLLSLSVLEATPSAWTMFLRQRESLVIVYRLLLGSMSLLVLILSPSLLGAQLVDQLLRLLESHQKNYSTRSSIEKRRTRSCWMRTLCLAMSVISQLLNIVLIIPLLRLVYYLRRRLGRIRGASSSSRGIGSTTPTSSNFNSSSDSLPMLALTPSSSKDSCILSSPTLAATAVSSNPKSGGRRRRGLCFLLLGSLVGVLLTMGILAIVAPLFIRTTTTTSTAAVAAAATTTTDTNTIMMTTTLLLSTAVSWLCAIGILLSACLNGFGSVSMPYACLAGLYLQPIRPEAITKAELELEKAQSLLEERRADLGTVSLILPTGGGGMGSSGSSSTSADYHHHHHHHHHTASTSVNGSNSNNTSAPSSGNTGWNKMTTMLSRAAGSGGGGTSKGGTRFTDLTEELNQRRRMISTEMDFLNVLVEEMKEELVEMRQAQHAAAMARTTMGQINSWLGVVFSVVLLMRLGSAMLFVWRHHRGLISSAIRGSDPVTMGMLWLIGNNYVTMTQQDYNTLSQFISLLLTAVLSVSQVRTFWRTVDSVYRRIMAVYRKMYGHDSNSTSSTWATYSTDEANIAGNATNGSNGSTSSVYAHIVSSLMVCYFVACIVLTKMMLPVDYRKSFSAALWQGTGSPNLNDGEEINDDGMLLFRIRTSAVNTAFIVSALISTFVLALLLGIQRQNTFRHLTAWSSSSSSTTMPPPALTMSKSNGSSGNMTGLEP